MTLMARIWLKRLAWAAVVLAIILRLLAR